MSTVVLIGGGHTHLHVLRALARQPRVLERWVLVTAEPHATYSGMLPGVLAGAYDRDAMHIALPPLCSAAGVELVIGEWSGLDLTQRQAHLADGRAFAFDVASIGIGSTSTRRGVAVRHDGALVPVKPISTFLDRLAARLDNVRQTRATRVRVVIVGAGAAGIEVALCMPAFIAGRLGPNVVTERTLLVAGERLLPQASRAATRHVDAACAKAGVRILRNARVAAIDDGQISVTDGTALSADIVIWATSADAPPVLAGTPIPLDAHGFPRTRATLQVASGDPVFVVGDAGSGSGSGWPKSGVTAVRQGPVLWTNLQRMLRGEALTTFQTPLHPLQILYTGDQRAIALWGSHAWSGRWCWHLKDRIDRRFIARHQPPAFRGISRAAIAASPSSSSDGPCDS